MLALLIWDEVSKMSLTPTKRRGVSPGGVRGSQLGCRISSEWQLALRGLGADVRCGGRSRLRLQAGGGWSRRGSLGIKVFCERTSWQGNFRYTSHVLETWRKPTVKEDDVLLPPRPKYSRVVFTPRRVGLNTIYAPAEVESNYTQAT